MLSRRFRSAGELPGVEVRRFRMMKVLGLKTWALNIRAQRYAADRTIATKLVLSSQTTCKPLCMFHRALEALGMLETHASNPTKYIIPVKSELDVRTS